MRKLPKFLYPLFWDIDPKKLDIDMFPRYVTERIMEWGDIPHVRWLIKTFKSEVLKDTLRTGHQLSKKSANFWALYLKVPKDKVLCLSEAFQKRYQQIWLY